MSDSTFRVLLVRKIGNAVDGSFEYLAERLPEVGDEIDLTQTFVAHSHGGSEPLRAKVTGIEKGKTLPIRATEL